MTDSHNPDILPMTTVTAGEVGGQPINIHITLDQPPVKEHKWRNRAIALGVASSLIVGAVVAVTDVLPNLFPFSAPKSHHDLEASVSDVRSFVVHDKTITFADVHSSFNYSERNQLRRPDILGIPDPFDCTATAEGRTETSGEAKVLIEEAAIDITGDKATITVGGDITASTNVEIQTLPETDIATGGTDFCKGDHEEDWAKRIAFGRKDNKHPEKDEDGVLTNAGEIATACAIIQEGRPAFDEAIIHYAGVFTKELKDINPKNITVEYKGGFDELAENNLNQKIAEFYKDFDDVADEYYNETDDHTKVKLNAKDLVDCEKHKIKVVPEEATAKPNK